MGEQPAPQLRLILASGSASRRQMLAAAGLRFDVMPSTVDEAAVKRRMHEDEREWPRPLGLGEAVAKELASAKALDVAAGNPGALVIGADQTLVLIERFDGRRVTGQEGYFEVGQSFDKPADIVAARAQLVRMRGKRHVLCSAVALARGGVVVWRHMQHAHLTMRVVSDAFLDDYLSRAGDKVCTSVGAYQLEGLGIQLFEAIEGDYFTILGLPLLPLLAELRRHGVIAA